MIEINICEETGYVAAMLDGKAAGWVSVKPDLVSKYNTEKKFRAFMNVCALEALQLFVTNEINKQIFINEEILNETA